MEETSILPPPGRRTIGIYAGTSPSQLEIGNQQFLPEDSPLGVCTSSGTVGPSLSFGKADAVCILSKSAALADAAATAVGNRVRGKKDIEQGLWRREERLRESSGRSSLSEKRMGVWGKIRLVRL